MAAALAAVAGLALATGPAGAATTGKAAVAKAKHKAATAAAAKAPPPEPVETLNPGQLDVSARVLTGVADCEFNQKITLQPVAARAGHFELQFQKQRYVMTPRETATGAVRLEDARSGMVWIQIPTKSMLMDSRRGQRVVDHCLQSEQRAALTAVKQAAESLGIEPTPSPAPASATATAATPATPGLAATPTAASAPGANPGTAAPTPVAVEVPAPVAALPAVRQP